MAAITDKCSPVNAQWMVDHLCARRRHGQALLAEGRKTWYFVTADYTFGHSLEKDASDMVTASAQGAGQLASSLPRR